MNNVQIRVASYNVHKCRGLDRRTTPERVSEVIREIDADIVAIQEVLNVENGRPEYDQTRRIAAALDGVTWCFGETRKSHGGAYGNVTLSRLPIQLCQNYDVTWRHRERRGCLRTDLALSKHLVLHVFNVHLGTGFVERRHQARRLLSDEVLKRPDFTGPRIVVGDFNEWTRGLASKLMGSAFEVVEPRTYPGMLPVLHLDQLYYDKQFSLKTFRLHRSRKSLMASDHLPLVAEFELQT